MTDPTASGSTSSPGEPAVSVEYLSCPRCGSSEYYRSKTRGKRERLVRLLLPVLYFRCRACGLRAARWYRPNVPRWRRKLLAVAGPAIAAFLLLQAMLYLASRGVDEFRGAGPAPTKKR